MGCILILTHIRLALVFFVIHKAIRKSLWGTRLKYILSKKIFQAGTPKCSDIFMDHKKH